ncbi:hypothetical protein [Paenarthrobacter sp. NEAU-H11]|uniref:hypothetical protein n=1 Tax=Paenarthrobacter sp. NEAU-H11 TaxID=3423924 RepID=UPI003D331AE9
MKIENEIRDLFRERERTAKELQRTVDKMLLNAKLSSWHYESRVKGAESFALKLETGRVSNPAEMEDFYAAVLVVPNALDIAAAESLIRDKFTFVSKKPESSDLTSKPSSSFTFDDLRMNVRYRAEDYELPSRIDGFLFEVQIRTFLQHAWSVATHDVTYKTDNVSWRRERIAHQIKALLEQAEVAVENMLVLQESKVLPASSARYDEINAVITTLQANWPADQLPVDVKRLAENVQGLLWNTLKESPPPVLIRLLENGLVRNAGAHSLDWSPYHSILSYLAHDYPVQLKKYLQRDDAYTKRFFIYSDVLSQLGLTGTDAKKQVVFP